MVSHLPFMPAYLHDYRFFSLSHCSNSFRSAGFTLSEGTPRLPVSTSNPESSAHAACKRGGLCFLPGDTQRPSERSLDF